MSLRTRALALGVGAAGAGTARAGEPGRQPLGRAASAALFERFKGLAGRWKGKSTRGWEEESVVRLIAGGSVVDVASSGAPPGSEMRTVYHLDGSRLMLTHYCIAKNQPRLVATAFDA